MSNRKRWRHKGRADGPSFAAIPHFVLASPQWGEMDAHAMKLLMELVRQYRGTNNGDLSATPEMLKERNPAWASRSTVYGKLQWLEDHGWIVKTRQGGRHIGCNLFAITWWPVDECNGKHHHPAEHKASHAWKNANGSTGNGTRKTVSRDAKPLAYRQTGSKVVRVRPAT